jgi:hypothetical protein
LLAAIGCFVFVSEVPAVAGGLGWGWGWGWPHHGYTYRSYGATTGTMQLAPMTTQHLMLTPVGVPVTGQTIQLQNSGTTQALQLLPGATWGGTLQLAPTTIGASTLQLVPTNATGTTLQLAPTSVGATTLQLVPTNATGATLQLAPTTVGTQTLQLVTNNASSATLRLAPSTNGTQTLTLGKDATNIDTAYHYLTLGLGGSTTKVQQFEQALKNKLSQLGGPGGPLSNPDLQAILLGTAKDLLRSNGFGIVLDDVFEPILKNFIGKVIQDGGAGAASQADNQNAGTPGPSGTSTTPAGSQVYDVSGRITLTPSAGGTSNGNPAQPRNQQGPAAANTITPDGNVAAPVIPGSP